MDVTTLADGAFGFACNKLALSPAVWCRATIWWRPNAANEHEPIRAVPFLPWGGAVSKITGTREHDHQLIQTTQQP